MLDDEVIQAVAQEAEEADWQEHVNAAMSNPTVASLSALTTFPERMEGVQASLGGYGPGRVSKNVGDAVSVASSLIRGHPKIAARLLIDRRKSLRNSVGAVGEDRQPIQTDQWGNSTEITDALLAHIRSGDPARVEQAKAIAGMVIAMSLDPEDVPGTLAKVGFKDDRTKEQKDAERQRLKLREEEDA